MQSDEPRQCMSLKKTCIGGKDLPPGRVGTVLLSKMHIQ